ncbi:hypothetical protein DERF_007913 [Dermatophagoides farinae]|uniref:Uncharacterized protein n=1 Tax=Dermatophagoides farinae TaxID=6954 RepID=A0A922I3A2_DERFA|nr:hypothetical protein HUG17_2212 [Dermatophagoides farinae]KAH9517231.1 hypothetical protein DERF_007913 [Dermatophagoides farinae]
MNNDFEEYIQTKLGPIKQYDSEDFLQLIAFISEYSYHFRIAEMLNIPFRQWLWFIIGLLIGEIIILWIIMAILVERLYVLAEFENDCQRRSKQQRRSVLLPPNMKINFNTNNSNDDDLQSKNYSSSQL